MPTILDQIVAAKREEVARAKAAVPEAVLRERLADGPAGARFPGRAFRPGRRSG